VGGLSLALPLRSYGRACDLLPALESVSHLLAILGGGEPVASRSEVLSDGTIRGQETLHVTKRFQPVHAPFPRAGRLVGVLRTIVERAVLLMFHTGGQLALGGAITLQPIRDEHARHICQSLEVLPKDLVGRRLITPVLDHDVEDIPLLIHGPPEVAYIRVG
jgi:hypothetical protein